VRQALDRSILDVAELLEYENLTEVTHVIDTSKLLAQAGKAGKPSKVVKGNQIIIVSGGYPGVSDEKAEIERIKNNTWVPATRDFVQTASDTQKSFSAASDVAQFMGALQAEPGSISRIVFVGHGNADGLALSGDSHGFATKTLTAQELDAWQNTIDSSIKPKLVEGATIDLIACNVAMGKQFMEKLAKSFGKCVRAYVEEVAWCVDHDEKVITLRGRIAPQSAIANKKLTCGDKAWQVGVSKMIPPHKVCP
jgi:hypothetical protein